jgi:hypothetical protein
MDRVRRFDRWGTNAALFALALQFVLSFGHVHIHGGWEAGHLAEAGLSLLAADDDSGAPSNPVDHHGADDDCAMCASIALAGSLLVPQAAILVRPVDAALACPSGRPAEAAPNNPTYHFNARAPPALS